MQKIDTSPLGETPPSPPTEPASSYFITALPSGKLLESGDDPLSLYSFPTSFNYSDPSLRFSTPAADTALLRASATPSRSLLRRSGRVPRSETETEGSAEGASAEGSAETSSEGTEGTGGTGSATPSVEEGKQSVRLERRRRRKMKRIGIVACFAPGVED